MNQSDFQGLGDKEKLDAIYKSVEKTRKYFFWTLVISLSFIVLPTIGLMFAIPQFLSAYNFEALGL